MCLALGVAREEEPGGPWAGPAHFLTTVKWGPRGRVWHTQSLARDVLSETTEDG